MDKHIVVGKWSPVRWIFKHTNFIAWTSPWGIVYYKSKEHMIPKVMRHEECHLMQMEREGKFMMMINYAIEFYRVGYWDNKYEVEAREAELVGT